MTEWLSGVWLSHHVPFQSLPLSLVSPGCVIPPAPSLCPLITTDNSTLQLVLTTVSAVALFVIEEDKGTTRALHSVEYSEAVKNIEEDLNVLLGSDLQDTSFVEKKKATPPCRTANIVHYSTCV